MLKFSLEPECFKRIYIYTYIYIYHHISLLYQLLYSETMAM